MTLPPVNPDRPNLVAVYGSLRRAHGNYAILSGASDSVVDGTVRGLALYPFAGTSFPACAVTGDSDDSVRVEVYAVSDEIFYRLDCLEGYPRFYDRKEVDVEGDDGETYRAWIYFLSPHEASRNGSLSKIESGDWTAFVRANSSPRYRWAERWSDR